jgi:hypothetical protein
MIDRKLHLPRHIGRWLVEQFKWEFDLNTSLAIRQAYRLALDQGFEVEGSAVERGAFFSAVDRKDNVDGINK